MKKILLIIFSFISVLTYGQKATISGYIEDAETGEKLIGANVYDSGKLIGTTSNTYGFFSLTLDTGNVTLYVSVIGYTTYKEEINLTENKVLNLSLKPQNEIEEVVVTGEELVHNKTQMSSVELSVDRIEKLPAFMGEKDIIKAIQLTPGIQSGSEGSSGLYVRGGGPDQNLILLDGVPVYNASHLFGFFSIFNTDAISKVEITKGGFPARYGGRTSSVLDIRMKEGNNKKFAAEASVGIISSKFTIEGPIIKDKTSFIVSGRRTYLDILAQPLIKHYGKDQGIEKAGYYFYDLNAKVNHKFSDKSRLYLSTYLGKDEFYFGMNDTYSKDSTDFSDNSTSGIDWGNLTSTIRYNYIISPKLFANVTGTYSKYKFTVGFGSENSVTSPDTSYTNNFQFEYLSSIQDWAGKVDFDYLPSPNHYVRFGFGNTYHTFTPGVNAVSMQGEAAIDTTFGSESIYGNEMSAYIEDDFKIGSQLKINMGLHYSMFFVKEKTYQSLQPRLSANYLISNNLSVKASYARMTQYLHLLTNGTIGLPTDLWVPVTDSVPPIISDQVALGFAYTLQNQYEFSIEGYYKKMDNLIEYKDGASFMGTAENWDKKIAVGSGDAYGAEFFLQKKQGKISGWIGYTLSWSNRLYDQPGNVLNFGREFSYKYDRRHDASFAGVYEFSNKFGKKEWSTDLGLVWVYGTGNAISLPISTYRALDAGAYSNGRKGDYSIIDNYENRNDFREPAYHRMDISATFTATKSKWEHSWNVSIYNVYNQQNPFMLQFNYNENNERVLQQVSLFPIIPSVSYNIKF